MSASTSEPLISASSHRRSPHSPANSDVENERRYLVGRADAELKATFLASCVEAECAHNILTHAYIDKCRGCSAQRTEACSGCKFRNVCDQVVAPAPPARASTEFSIEPILRFSERSSHPLAAPRHALGHANAPDSYVIARPSVSSRGRHNGEARTAIPAFLQEPNQCMPAR